MKSFFSLAVFIFILAAFFIICLCFFIPIFSNYGLVTPYIPNSDDLYINIANVGFIWPTPRL